MGPTNVKITLRRFDLRKITDDCVVVLIGKRNTGKSVVLKDILYSKQDFPFGFAVSMSEEAKPFFGNFMPNSLVFNEYDNKIVDSLKKRQKTILQKMQKMNEELKRKIDSRAFLVLDDCLADAKSWKNSTQIREMFMNGRHYDIMFMLTLQYPKGITPNLRSNVDFVVITRGYGENLLRSIYLEYCDCVPTFDMFKKIMASLGEYEVLVIDKLSQSSKLEEKIFYYKATLRGDMKLCRPCYWEKSNKNVVNNSISVNEFNSSKSNRYNYIIDKN